MGHMQGRPFEEAGAIQKQADDDDRDKGRRGVPDDSPNGLDIGEVDDARQQRQDRAYESPPADLEAFGLNDDEGEG
jgi:hypothetical protein